MRHIIHIAAAIAFSVSIAQGQETLPPFCHRPMDTLSPAQQKACAEYRAKNQPPSDDAYRLPKHNWKRVEADNGAAYAIDLSSISHGYTFSNVTGASKTADAVVCIVQNDICDIMNQRRWTFYCPQNQIVEQTDAGFTPAQYVPPRSIGKRILDIACSK